MEKKKSGRNAANQTRHFYETTEQGRYMVQKQGPMGGGQIVDALRKTNLNATKAFTMQGKKKKRV